MESGYVPKESTRSYWRGDESETVKICKSSSNETCEVVVIGAGMSGVSCAAHLAKNGVDVILVDARKMICDGATGRNGGFVHAHGFNMLPLMLRKRSFFDAYGLIRVEQVGREVIREITRDRNINCDLWSNKRIAIPVCTNPRTITNCKIINFFI